MVASWVVGLLVALVFVACVCVCRCICRRRNANVQLYSKVDDHLDEEEQQFKRDLEMAGVGGDGLFEFDGQEDLEPFDRAELEQLKLLEAYRDNLVDAATAADAEMGQVDDYGSPERDDGSAKQPRDDADSAAGGTDDIVGHKVTLDIDDEGDDFVEFAADGEAEAPAGGEEGEDKEEDGERLAGGKADG